MDMKDEYLLIDPNIRHIRDCREYGVHDGTKHIGNSAVQGHGTSCSKHPETRLPCPLCMSTYLITNPDTKGTRHTSNN